MPESSPEDGVDSTLIVKKRKEKKYRGFTPTIAY